MGLIWEGKGEGMDYGGVRAVMREILRMMAK